MSKHTITFTSKLGKIHKRTTARNYTHAFVTVTAYRGNNNDQPYERVAYSVNYKSLVRMLEKYNAPSVPSKWVSQASIDRTTKHDAYIVDLATGKIL
jgi:cytochrome c biogenesis factor